MENISEKLKYLRGKKKINQSYIADLLGLSVASYSDIEREKTKPSIEHISVLSKFYGISSDTLLGLNDVDVHLIDFSVVNDQTQKSTPNNTPNNTPNEQINKPNTHYSLIHQSSVMMEIITSQRQLIEHLSAQIKELKDNKAK